jgi:hypothetical protein
MGLISLAVVIDGLKSQKLGLVSSRSGDDGIDRCSEPYHGKGVHTLVFSLVLQSWEAQRSSLVRCVRSFPVLRAYTRGCAVQR